MATDLEKENANEIEDFETGAGDNFEAPSEFAPPPPKGTYTFMRIDEGNEYDYVVKVKTPSDKPKYLSFAFSVAIQGSQWDGRVLRFVRVNTQVPDWKQSSSADEYLAACKSSRHPRTKDEWLTTMANTFGPFQAKIDWEWTCRDCKDDNDFSITFLKGMKSPRKPKNYDGPTVKVSKRADGSTEHVVKCPECGNAVGAQAVIRSYVIPSAVSSNGGGTNPSRNIESFVPPPSVLDDDIPF